MKTIVKTEQLLLNVGERVCWHFSQLMKSTKKETTETIDIICDFCSQWNFTFWVESSLCDSSPLDRCNHETKQINGGEIPRSRFYYIDRVTTCFADIPSFRSKLSEIWWSIIRGFDPSEKGAEHAVEKFPWDAFTTYIDRNTSICRGIPYTFLLGLLTHFLTILYWPSSDKMQTSSSPDPDSETPCHSYMGVCQVCMITKLVKNRCLHF